MGIDVPTTLTRPRTNARGAIARARDHIFFGAMAISAATVVVIGFAPSYYFRAHFGRPPVTPVQAVHGAVFSTWILLSMIQPLLVGARFTALHRRLGVLGAVVAAAVVVSGAFMAITAARAGHAPPGWDARAFLAIPLFEVILFAPMVVAGLWLRRRPQAHKRLLLLATVSILGAPSARLPQAIAAAWDPFFFVPDMFVLALVAYDLATRGRLHPATCWGGLALVVSQPLRGALGRSAAWIAVAGLLVHR